VSAEDTGSTRETGSAENTGTGVDTRVLAALDIDRIRADFPILSRQFDGRPLVYLDNAATSQKPQAVIDTLTDYYSNRNANVHRAIHRLGEEATAAYEGARESVARLINAPDPHCCIFVRNTTEGLNLVANAWGRTELGAGDEILITEMEHHSNIVPWQLVAEATGARVLYAPITADGRLDLEAFADLITERTRVVSVAHASNVLGTVNPVPEIAALAREAGALMVLDAAQSVPHMPVDVEALGIDFMAFSSHKMYGPTGSGILWGRRELLEAMPPFHGGGDMIDRVSKKGTTFARLPYKFEAGTPDIGEAIAMGAAAEYMMELGVERIAAREEELVGVLLEKLETIPGITIHGPATGRAALAAFSLETVHPHDVSTFLDADGIAVRAGHHCTHILHDVLGVSATTRASLAFYNVEEEIDRLVESLQKIVDFFS